MSLAFEQPQPTLSSADMADLAELEQELMLQDQQQQQQSQDTLHHNEDDYQQTSKDLQTDHNQDQQHEPSPLHPPQQPPPPPPVLSATASRKSSISRKSVSSSIGSKTPTLGSPHRSTIQTNSISAAASPKDSNSPSTFSTSPKTNNINSSTTVADPTTSAQPHLTYPYNPRPIPGYRRKPVEYTRAIVPNHPKLGGGATMLMDGAPSFGIRENGNRLRSRTEYTGPGGSSSMVSPNMRMMGGDEQLARVRRLTASDAEMVLLATGAAHSTSPNRRENPSSHSTRRSEIWGRRSLMFFNFARSRPSTPSTQSSTSTRSSISTFFRNASNRISERLQRLRPSTSSSSRTSTSSSVPSLSTSTTWRTFSRQDSVTSFNSFGSSIAPASEPAETYKPSTSIRSFGGFGGSRPQSVQGSLRSMPFQRTRKALPTPDMFSPPPSRLGASSVAGVQSSSISRAATPLASQHQGSLRTGKKPIGPRDSNQSQNIILTPQLQHGLSSTTTEQLVDTRPPSALEMAIEKLTKEVELLKAERVMKTPEPVTEPPVEKISEPQLATEDVKAEQKIVVEPTDTVKKIIESLMEHIKLLSESKDPQAIHQITELKKVMSGYLGQMDKLVSVPADVKGDEELVKKDEEVKDMHEMQSEETQTVSPVEVEGLHDTQNDGTQTEGMLQITTTVFTEPSSLPTSETAPTQPTSFSTEPVAVEEPASSQIETKESGTAQKTFHRKARRSPPPPPVQIVPSEHDEQHVTDISAPQGPLIEIEGAAIAAEPFAAAEQAANNQPSQEALQRLRDRFKEVEREIAMSSPPPPLETPQTPTVTLSKNSSPMRSPNPLLAKIEEDLVPSVQNKVGVLVGLIESKAAQSVGVLRDSAYA
ncbi:hypothetical protein HDV05_002788 [Chytridiales sp. JEL 0842]|nr:hypothetical protein HDV05_002788 [Chytridiales sp. JEL 0842]